MSILRSYKVNSYRRICDICGRPRQIEDIRFADGVAICTIHPEFRTAQQLNRINARARPTRVLPVPNPKPLSPVDTWTVEEAQIFNFVCATSPFETVDVTSNAGAITGGRSYQAAGWAIVYLAALIEENKRPANWYALALKVAVAAGDYLVSQQEPAANDAFVGALKSTTTNQPYFTIDTSVACAALCRLYQITGAARYLAAAKSAAGALINFQATQLWTAPGVAPTYIGALPSGFNRSAGEFFVDYKARDLLGLWALSLLQGIVGDIVVGSTTTGFGVFSAPPAKLLSTAISDMRGFWASGVSGVTGLSAVTPFSTYTQASGWSGTVLTSDDWPVAIFALAETDGVTTQVSDLWDYLVSFGSSTSFSGTYDPTLTVATSVDTGTKKNASGFYDWAAAGLMAKTTATRSRTSIKAAKDATSVPRARFSENTPRSGDTLYLGPLGLSTLRYEPITSSPPLSRKRSVARASQVGLLYRQLPQGFTGRGHA